MSTRVAAFRSLRRVLSFIHAASMRPRAHTLSTRPLSLTHHASRFALHVSGTCLGWGSLHAVGLV